MITLTHEQLGITPDEYRALIWVRNALDPSIPDHTLPQWMRFDMNRWGHLDTRIPLGSCDTAFCIGGSMEIYLSGLVETLKVGDKPTMDQASDWSKSFYKLTGDMQGSEALRPLFYDFPDDAEACGRIYAVGAIDRFLSGNTKDPWQIDID